MRGRGATSGRFGIEANRAGEMAAFVEVLERGSFSAAARALGMTPSALSKLVARLEARLGARLLHRSTRRLEPTAEGRQFHQASVRVLADMDEAERGVAAVAAPRGRVGINTSPAFAAHLLLPLIPKLLARHPGLELDISLTDRVVDLIDARADIAIRWGRLPDSDLVARRLGETAQAIVGSPGYVGRRHPRTPADLARYRLLDFSYRASASSWPFRIGRRIVEVPVRGALRASDGEALRQLAIAGAGLARLSRYQVEGDIRAGRLVAVLEHCNPRDLAPVHAVYLGRPGRLPSRVRAVLDFLADQLGRDSRLGGGPGGAQA